MADQTPKDENLPTLGKLLTWVDRPGSANKIFWALAVLCLVLLVSDFTYEKHEYVHQADMPGFYGIFGFVAFSCVIFGAKLLRTIIKRDENFYGDKSVDTEEYPIEGTDRVNYDV